MVILVGCFVVLFNIFSLYYLLHCFTVSLPSTVRALHILKISDVFQAPEGLQCSSVSAFHFKASDPLVSLLHFCLMG